MRAHARRYQTLTEEMAEQSAILDDFTAQANPALRAAKGVDVDVAAILVVADALGTSTSSICRLELGHTHDITVACRY